MGKRPKAAVSSVSSKFSAVQNICNEISGVKVIENTDNLCLVRAILVGKAYSDKEQNRYLLTRKNNKELNKRVKRLSHQLGIENKVQGIPTLMLIEQTLKDYQITLYGENRLIPTPLYTGEMKEKFIYIVQTKNHFNVITSMARYLSKNLFCDACKIGYTSLGNHVCIALCSFCHRKNCHGLTFYPCEFCFVKCNISECKRIHESRFCYKKKICSICNRVKNRIHLCLDEDKWCSNCKKGGQV